MMIYCSADIKNEWKYICARQCLNGMHTDRVTFTIMMAGVHVKAQYIVRFAECGAAVAI